MTRVFFFSVGLERASVWCSNVLGFQLFQITKIFFSHGLQQITKVWLVPLSSSVLGRRAAPTTPFGSSLSKESACHGQGRLR